MTGRTEIARRIGLLLEDNWWDGHEEFRDGHLCLGMALMVVDPGLAEYGRMLEVIEELFPGKASFLADGGRAPLTCIPVFNDQASREDVFLVLKHYGGQSSDA